MTQEQWKRIDGYNSYYWASDQGRIKNNDDRIMSSSPNDNGYLVVGLSDGSGRSRRRLIHKLALETFVGSCPDGLSTRHVDGDKLNNHLYNLKWGTWTEQVEDKRRLGRIPTGENHKLAKLTNDEVRKFLLYCKRFCKKNDVSIWALEGILKKKTWKHLYKEIIEDK